MNVLHRIKQEPTNMWKPWRLVAVVGSIAILGLIIAAPWFTSPYYVRVLTAVLIDIILVSSFRFVTLMGGWSFAQVALMGMGAYTAAILAMTFGWPFWVVLPLGGLGAAFSAAIISSAVLRCRGIYFFLATFATGGALAEIWKTLQFPFRGKTGFWLSSLPFQDMYDSYYFFVLAFTVLCVFAMYLLEKTHLGFTIKTVASQERLAESVGVDILRHRFAALVIGSFFAGLAGVLYIYMVGGVTPQYFTISHMMSVVIWTVVGGTSALAGPIISVSLFTVIREATVGLVEYYPLILGATMVIIVIFLPGGLSTLPDRIRGRKTEPTPIVKYFQSLIKRHSK